MKRTIFTIALSVFVVSTVTHAAIFYDDFEDGTLDQWTIGGRQLGRESIAEVVDVFGNHIAHLFQDGFTEIEMLNTFDYRENLNFSFDLQTTVASDGTAPDTLFASAGVEYSFLNGTGQQLGRVIFANRTIAPPPFPSPDPTIYFSEIGSSPQSYNHNMQYLLSLISVEESSIQYVDLRFYTYTSGNEYNMSADILIDNVAVIPEPCTLLLLGLGGLALRIPKKLK